MQYIRPLNGLQIIKKEPVLCRFFFFSRFAYFLSSVALEALSFNAKYAGYESPLYYTCQVITGFIFYRCPLTFTLITNETLELQPLP